MGFLKISRFAVILLVLSLFPSALLGSSLQVLVEIAGNRASVSALEGTLKVTPLGQLPEGAPEKALQFKIQAPGRKVLDVTRMAWELSVEVPGHWAPPRVVTPTSENETVTLTLWPTGTLTGSVETTGNEDMPAELSVRFVPSPDTKTEGLIAQTAFVCPIEEKRWTCDLPAVELDLRLRAKGFVSHFRWSVAVAAEKRLDLGKILLKRGASLVGQVETAEGVVSPKFCKVEITPMAAANTLSPDEKNRLKQLLLSKKVTERGFFHFEAIPPGSYILTARQPGFAETRLYPVTVMENAETALRDPLVLELPLALEVRINPPVDLYQKPWKVILWQLSTISGSVEEVTEEMASETGIYIKEGLSESSYLIMVHNAVGDKMAGTSFELTPTSTVVDFELSIVWVEGTLRLGDESLSADVIFGGPFGSEKMSMAANEDGEFSGYLPRDGEWLVFIESADPPISRFVPDVEVRIRKNKNLAEVEIVLPNTELLGTVVDEEGRSEADALIQVWDRDAARHTTTEPDREGRFNYRGLPEGPTVVWAEAGSGTLVSDQYPIHLIDGRHAEVELVLHERQEITGRVLSSSGPVPGALVQAKSFTAYGADPLIGRPSATTDVTGSFQIFLPRAARFTQITAFPPGYALTVLPIAEVDDEPLTIRVEPYVGTVVFDMKESLDWGRRLDPKPYLFVDGKVIGRFTLKKWADIHGVKNKNQGETFVVPALPPGHYTACMIAPDRSRFFASPQPLDGRCSQGYLAPSAELRLGIAAAAP